MGVLAARLAPPDVAALNERARQRCVEAGLVSGPELEPPGGKRYAVGDRIVTLAPSGDGRFVTSERGTVFAIEHGRLAVRFDDGRRDALSGEELNADRLDHAYAITVHRMQGGTVDRAHVLADGGGRELAYVAMSRARAACHLYVVADDVHQAAEDLTVEWRRDARQRWVLDTDAVAGDGARPGPELRQGLPSVLRQARLAAERRAVDAVAPWAEERLRALDMQLRLERLERSSHTRPAARGLGLG